MFAGIVAKAADGASRDAGLWADLKGQNHLCSDDFVEAMQVRVRHQFTHLHSHRIHPQIV